MKRFCWMAMRFVKISGLVTMFFFLPEFLWPDKLFRGSDDYKALRGGIWEEVAPNDLVYHKGLGPDLDLDSTWWYGHGPANDIAYLRNKILVLLAAVGLGVFIGWR